MSLDPNALSKVDVTQLGCGQKNYSFLKTINYVSIGWTPIDPSSVRILEWLTKIKCR